MKQSLPIRRSSGDPVARPCACRGYLVADPADADAVERAAQEHGRTIQHQTWRAIETLDGRLVAGDPLLVGRGRDGRPLLVSAQLRRIA